MEMIEAIVKIENQWNKGEILEHRIEFEKIGQIEDYLAYNRGYIQEIEFVGKFVKEEY
jgi:hypothetical protein